MEERKKPHVDGESIGEAYFNALSLVKEKNPYQYLMVHISKPVCDTSIEKSPQSLNIDEWCKFVNIGSVFERFSRFNFSKKCEMGGSSGKDWINDRIKALLHPDGVYYRRLEKQIGMVGKRLQAKNKWGKRMHGSSTNALVCHTSSPTDLEKACKPRPNAKGLPCLTMLDFKPKRDKFSLLAVFRSQYFDTKAYGNFISLAILLYKMCQKTKYEVGVLVSTANNVTFHDKRRISRIYDFLAKR